MTQQFDRERESNFAELTRRFEQLTASSEVESSTVQSGELSITGVNVPPSDPTGLIELLQTMRRETISHAQMLTENYPFWESIFTPIPPWKAGFREADHAVSELLNSAVAYLKGFEQDKDYVIFNDPMGEVVTFHFQTEEARLLFRRATGLDEAGGFNTFIEKFSPRDSSADS